MEDQAKTRFEESVHSRIKIIENFFTTHATQFQTLFRDSLKAASVELDLMFARTYGPFYLSHSQIFNDFFERLSNTFVTQLQLNPARLILDDFYRTLYKTIFEIMNPVYITLW
ncbi:hypothetical protein L596_002713 [Steinernema carpocapsae]|nr:hypothetical protein L596_002713 [Steinernema carpocapsae]